MKNEQSGGGMPPSSKPRSKRRPAAKAHRYRDRLDDVVTQFPKRKRANAQKHGVFVVTPTIPGEDPREFQELHSALIEEWRPCGRTEEDIVLSIADRMWRKLRSQRFVRTRINLDTVFAEHPIFEEARALLVFAYYMHFRPETAFENYAEKYLHPDTIAHLKQNFPRSNYQTADEWSKAVIDEIESLLFVVGIPNYDDSDHWLAKAWRELFGQEKFAVSFNWAHKLLDDDLTLQERLDAEIARLVKNLVQLKAMKQMLPQTSATRDDEQPKRITARSA